MSKHLLYLVRHAESEGNAGKIMQGAGEYPLSVEGQRQARSAAGAVSLIAPTFVASSDLTRASDTALLAAGRIDLTDPRLRERGAGVWEGRLRAELEELHPGSLKDDSLRPEGFEDQEEVIRRMRAAAADLLNREETVMAFTHGAVMRTLERHLGGSGARFGHLEALILKPGLVISGRTTLLDEKTES